MMGYGLSNVGLWGAFGGVGTLGFLTWLIVFIDLVLLAVWLWKQINK
ncbi:MAG: hypothetical protein HYT27_02475 [Parcubacteria group bacterium]|nr:hypothetical protein [Parcubacteria group bacterium]